VFAPLAESYRKMGLLEEALDTAQKGVNRHPKYSSGQVALARILIDCEKHTEAIPHLESALEINNGNLLALRMRGHCWFQLKNYPKALQSYKRLLFFHPNDEAALGFVKKWEFLEGHKYEWTLIQTLTDEELSHWVISLPSEKDILTIVDTAMVHEDFTSARRFLKLGYTRWPDSEVFRKRWDMIQSQDPARFGLNLKKQFWKKWLHRVEKRQGEQGL